MNTNKNIKLSREERLLVNKLNKKYYIEKRIPEFRKDKWNHLSEEQKTTEMYLIHSLVDNKVLDEENNITIEEFVYLYIEKIDDIYTPQLVKDYINPIYNDLIYIYNQTLKEEEILKSVKELFNDFKIQLSVLKENEVAIISLSKTSSIEIAKSINSLSNYIKKNFKDKVIFIAGTDLDTNFMNIVSKEEALEIKELCKSKSTLVYSILGKISGHECEFDNYKHKEKDYKNGIELFNFEYLINSSYQFLLTLRKDVSNFLNLLDGSYDPKERMFVVKLLETQIPVEKVPLKYQKYIKFVNNTDKWNKDELLKIDTNMLKQMYFDIIYNMSY